METMQFEPMSVGRIFDRAFLIYRNNFLRFVTIVAVIEVPMMLLSLGWRAFTRVDYRAPSSRASASASLTRSPLVADADQASPFAASAPSFPYLAVFGSALLLVVTNLLCQAALIKNVSEAYLGNEIAIGQAYRFVFPKLLTLIVASLLVMLVVGLGFLLLFVPGIIFGLWLALTTPAIVVENQGAFQGMSRSRALTSGNLGKVFAVNLLAGLIAWIVSIPLAWLASRAGLSLFAESEVLRAFLNQFAGTVSQVLVLPIGAAASILLYYDLRIRKEGFDLQMLAQSMATGQGMATGQSMAPEQR